MDWIRRDPTGLYGEIADLQSLVELRGTGFPRSTLLDLKEHTKISTQIERQILLQFLNERETVVCP